MLFGSNLDVTFAFAEIPFDRRPSQKIEPVRWSVEHCWDNLAVKISLLLINSTNKQKFLLNLQIANKCAVSSLSKGLLHETY